MIKIVRICAGFIPPVAVFTFIVGCSPSTFTKEQELYEDVARYACYAAAGQKATEALHEGCPNLLRNAKSAVSCPIVDQVIAVLQSDLEKCDEPVR